MRKALLLCSLLILSACAAPLPSIPVDSRSVEPGTEVMRGSDTLKLLGKPLRVGDPLPAVNLFNKSLQTVNLADLRGNVLLISVVPSLDTQVCERQTHQLAEEGSGLPPKVELITISRDLPFAQKRFSDEAPELGKIHYLSDYAEANFGRDTGLLLDKIHLLARALLVVDAEGIVRYLQIVPTITHLPDMQKAVAFAAKLAD